MSTTTQLFTTPTYNEIDRSVRALDIKAISYENTLLPIAQSDQVKRVLRVYRAVRPLLAAIASLPLLPWAWRSAITLLVETLETLAGGDPDSQHDFKAGKDL
ncbi:MAG TPA: hypothetical protein VE974_05035 [Thermoanaerobaculia bacterium]|nr:hypothetical protein [Thermoanaerobaculia bacterium]